MWYSISCTTNGQTYSGFLIQKEKVSKSNKVRNLLYPLLFVRFQLYLFILSVNAIYDGSYCT